MNELIEENPIFGDFFNEWRIKRVNKLLEVFGKDWFKGKTVLELGCAFGNVGLYLETLGADVTYSDARQECLDEVLKKNPNATTIRIDQDSEWHLDETFDLVVHFGISYNLKNWQQDIINAIKHGKFVALETAVNKFSNEIEFPIKNYSYSHEYHGAFNNVGSLASVALFEKTFDSQGAKYKRYDDADLNISGCTIYTYPCDKIKGAKAHNEVYLTAWADPKVSGGRKFWIIGEQTWQNTK